jgi:hypothetical protein
MMILPEFKLTANPTDQAARELQFNSWSDPEIGTRHKLGGKPDFIQSATWPKCKSCHDDMSFYCQVDSLNDSNGEYDIGDCGMIYTFFCFDCNQAESIVQSY